MIGRQVSRHGRASPVHRPAARGRGKSPQVRELMSYGIFRLEFVADTGTAITGPLPT